jgi:hypothetical protein
MLVVYTIIEPTKEGAKPYWQRLGVAFKNRDDSINVILNGLPVNGKLHIREEEPRDKDAPRGGQGQGNAAKHSEPAERNELPIGAGLEGDDYPF